MIKVAIADDQVLFRDMLTMMLLQDQSIHVVGCAGNGDEIIELCASKHPEIVIMDIKMPGTDGLDALSIVKKRFPAIKVIMLTTFEDDESILKANKNGADGYILKDIKPHALVLAVKSIYEGLIVMHERAYRYLSESIESNNRRIVLNSDENKNIDFDRIDLAIMRSLAEGRNNREIAAILNFSEGTVKNRISRILNLTGLKDRTQVAVFALKNKII